MQQHGLVLDFSSNAVQVYPKVKHTDVKWQELRQIVEEAWNNKPHVGIIAAVNDDSSELTEECAIPNFGTSKAYELPENCGDEFRQLIEEHKDLFCTTPGKTTCDCHYIPTKGPPIRVPPRRIPGHRLLDKLNRCYHKVSLRRAVAHGWLLFLCLRNPEN